MRRSGNASVIALASCAAALGPAQAAEAPRAIDRSVLRSPPVPSASTASPILQLHVPVERTVAGAFSASETLDLGTDLGSPVSLSYFDRGPFALVGRIAAMHVDFR